MLALTKVINCFHKYYAKYIKSQEKYGKDVSTWLCVGSAWAAQSSCKAQKLLLVWIN